MNYAQNLKVNIFHIDAGKSVCVLNDVDAKELGVFIGDRVEITNKKTGEKIVAVVDTTCCAIKEKEIGLFETVAKKINIKSKQNVLVSSTSALKSVEFIKKKMNGEKLSGKELKEIVSDISSDKLSDIEASAFMSAVYMKNFDLEETAQMTKALIENGRRISFSASPIVDKHSIGGVNGRATMIIVPIVASAGLYIPKTSSRSITSSAGTADAMEVLCPVNLDFEKIKSITKKQGGVIAWGGAVDLAPADDKIIRIRHPLSLDPQGMLIASVLAKKASVGSKYVVIDVPVGDYSKVKDKKSALEIAKKFVKVGKQIGMEVEVVITNGDEPSGKAFGPVLESKYVLEILEGKRFDNLAQKSCELSGALFELAGICSTGRGYELALEILNSGKALKKMKSIIKAQGGKIFSSRELVFSHLNKEIKSKETGVIQHANIEILTKIARIAGAPANPKAGLMLNLTQGDKVKTGDTLYTIYAENQVKLKSALDYAKKHDPFTLKKIIISTVR